MTRRGITEDEARFFDENGYLIVRNAIGGEELERVRAAMADVTEYGSAAVRDHPDYMYGVGHRSGGQVLKRVEYVIDKRDECKALLGNPFILHSVERLLGPDLIPTWDSMVLKLPGEGIVVPWHRDAGTEYVGDTPIFNVDFYLDEADENTCVWVIPGSHKWPEAQARAEIARRAHWTSVDAVPALMQPGDVLFHNILLLHGSPANTSDKLRRVIYYEFRSAHVEAEMGPHVPSYVALKQKVLLACLRKRQSTGWITEEEPFEYHPPSPFDAITLEPSEELPTYRYPHGEYWR